MTGALRPRLAAVALVSVRTTAAPAPADARVTPTTSASGHHRPRPASGAPFGRPATPPTYGAGGTLSRAHPLHRFRSHFLKRSSCEVVETGHRPGDDDVG